MHFIGDVLKKIALRSVLVFILIHAGLVFGIIGLSQISQDTNIYGTTTWYFLLTAVVVMYASLFLAMFFIMWPIYSLVKLVKKVLAWREWILTDLPKIIAMIPQLIEALRKAFDPATSGPINSVAEDPPGKENSPS